MKRELRIAICEDQEADAAHLARCIRGYARAVGLSVVVDVFPSGNSLLDGYEPGGMHIAFLDIYMEGIDGVETARRLRKRGEGCPIVFTTQSEEHALNGYGVEALHYLVKPIDQRALDEAMARCYARILEASVNSCTIMVDRRPVRIALKEILYAEIQNKNTIIHTTSGDITARMPIGELEALLPAPPFLRCHRCYIVNADRVAAIGEGFVMENGDNVYIRQSHYKKIKSLYTRYVISLARGEVRCLEDGAWGGLR